MNNYLPSKQFISKVVVIFLLLVLALGIYKLVIIFKNKKPSGARTLIIKPDVIQKDSNGNSIPDWEESLWGLDPHKNGDENRQFILAKRRDLAKESNVTLENQSGPLSENETLAREFFAIIMSLQESGDLNEVSIQSIGDTIGEKITATPIADIYSASMLEVTKANPANTNTYSDALSKLFDKYKNEDIGKELTFISVALSTNDPGALKEAGKVGASYKAFGRDLLKITVPNTFSGTHTALANDYEKVGETIDGMSVMLDDPITGMKSIINYKKYSDALVADIEKLSNQLE